MATTTSSKLRYGWQGEREEYVYPPIKRYNHLVYFPDPMIERILRLLPTATAVRMSLLSKQWQNQWSTVRVLDFDEYDHHPNHNNRPGFINLVKNCCMKFSKAGEPLDKFRLRMKPVGSSDHSGKEVHNLLSLALKAGVKELDISFSPVTDTNPYFLLSDMYKSTPYGLFSSKSITSLKLEGVKVYCTGSAGSVYLPSLKRMSLQAVYYDKGLSNFIKRCPSIESLSLSSHSLLEHFFRETFEVSSSSLKSLEVENSRGTIQVDASNLESFTFVSEYYSLVTLKACRNLKCVDIQAPYLKHLELLGCEDGVKGAIDARNLLSFHFRGYGWIKSKVSMKAPDLSEVVVDLRDREAIVNWSQLECSPTLKAFFNQIGCSKEITGVDVDEAFILSNEFRTSSRDDKNLRVLVINSPQ